MSKKSIDELLETYVPSCMDKAVDHYEEESKKIDSPSDQYTKRMEKLIRREELKKRYHIPIKNSRRVAAMILICLIAGMTVTLKVDAVRMKVYEVISSVYSGYTSKEYILKEGQDRKFVPSYPTVIPQGYTLRNEELGEKWLIQEYRNEAFDKMIVLDEEWLEDGVIIYEDNEFDSVETVENNGTKFHIGYKKDEIVIIWDNNNCKFSISSNESNKNALIKMAESMKIKK